MIRKLLSFFMLFFMLSVGYAEEIKDIKFNNLTQISDEIALEIIGIFIGENLDIGKIDKSIKNLFSRGYFSDIWVDIDSNGTLTYNFKERPLISFIEISGYDSKQEDTIIAAMGIKKGDIYDINQVENARKNILNFLESKNLYDSTVKVEAENINKNSIKLSFMINKGYELIIDDVSLYGTGSFTYSQFKNVIANKKGQFLGWVWGRDDGKVIMEQLKYDPSRIANFYRKNGFLDVVVSDPLLLAHFDSYTATLSYIVEQGELYHVSDINIYMQKDVINVDELYKSMSLKKDGIFDTEKLSRDIALIKRIISDKGYAFTQVIPNIKKNEDNKTASLSISVIPNNVVFIKNIIIGGNTKTIDKIIRREMLISETDKYNLTEIEESRNALSRTGYFSKVNIEESRVSKDEINLLVNVEETSTAYINGGFGFSTSDGFIVGGSITDRNIFGSGIEVGANVDISTKRETDGYIYFKNPRIFDSIYSLTGSAYARQYSYYDYDSRSEGISLALGRKIGNYTTASLGYVFEHSDIVDSSISDLPPTYYRPGGVFKSSIVPSISFNNTDDYLLPRKGVNLYSNIEYAGVGGSVNFLKNTNTFSYFLGLGDLIDYDLILRYKGTLGLSTDLGYYPVYDRFYMGGIDSVRGYQTDSISPKYDGILVGGTLMFVNNFEASIPLIESSNLRLKIFFDYGFIGEDNFDIHRGGTGAGIEWVSPIGALQILFAYPINKHPGDEISNFEFTIGRPF